MFSTNVMNEQIENNKQTNRFLKIFIRKPISSGSDPTEINTKIICLRSGAFPYLS